MWGTVVNGLILAPYFLVLSLLIGYLHFSILEHTFFAFVAMLAICSLGLATALFQRGRDTDTEQLQQHIAVEDRVKRFIGCIVLGGLLSLFVLAIPFIVELARNALKSGDVAWISFGSSMLGVMTSMAGIQKLLPGDKTEQKPLLLALICLLGLLSLYALLILLENFVVYGNPMTLMWPQMLFLFSEPWTYFYISVLSAVAMIGACLVRGLQTRPLWTAIIPLTVSHGSLLFLVLYSSFSPGEIKRKSDPQDRLVTMRYQAGEITRPLVGLASAPLDPARLDPSIAPILERIRIFKSNLDKYYEFRPQDYPDIDSNRDSLRTWSANYFTMAQAFADEAGRLIDLNETSLNGLRQELAFVDRQGLKSQLQDFHKQLLPQETQGLLYAALAHQIAQEMLALKTLHSPSQPSLSGINDPIVFGDIKNEVFKKLLGFKANASHQYELATLLGRESEIDLSLFLDRKTVAAIGTFQPFEQISEWDEEIEVAVDEAIVENFVASIPSSSTRSELSALPQEIDSKLRTSIRNALLRRILLEWPPNILRHLGDAQRRDAIGYASYQQDLLDKTILQKAESLRRDFGFSENELAEAARDALITKALKSVSVDGATHEALIEIGLLSLPPLLGAKEGAEELLYAVRAAQIFSAPQIARIVVSKYGQPLNRPDLYQSADSVVLMVANGTAGDLNAIKEIRQQFASNTFPLMLRVFLLLTSVIGLVCFCIADINASSMHGYYRNQLTRAFFLENVGKKLVPARGVRLSDLRETGSVSPYTIINTAINMQASRDLSLRDRKSDFFVFSKLFCGGNKTKYVTTKEIERALPSLTLGTAMAISAAAVAPNMGRNTNGFAVLLMTLFNARLGFWVPNPKKLSNKPVDFPKVFAKELSCEVHKRWSSLYGKRCSRIRAGHRRISTEHELVGLAFSGGGIRSAAVNLGISQSLNKSGIFGHVDYLSTVSGGGYTGAAIAVAMRHPFVSGDTEAQISNTNSGERFKHVSTSARSSWCMTFGQSLKSRISRWRLPEWYFAKEMTSCLHDGSDWVNVSDGGHIENLAAIELLRRRCKFIIIGDGEADPNHSFNGMGILIGLAKLELGADIDIDLSPLKLTKGRSRKHFAIGRVTYQDKSETGTILYMKSSITGDEGEFVHEYRSRCNSFPHEGTHDQFFDIGQFEAYRSLGVHIGEAAIGEMRLLTGLSDDMDLSSFSVFKRWFQIPRGTDTSSNA